ncbi:hypothetical protein SELMODRAFT_420460 [Selaginella moellendorffii]|uniref:NAD-dependent epimerase/dehydratase domain-containing protein n=1 Tax=Selaginella moellendorffii TaxID=88036 RepID=D8SC22_SELML|nr:hypothetical protein SELMODRAFT_420460 [Selaginella moellendorffii]
MVFPILRAPVPKLAGGFAAELLSATKILIGRARCCQYLDNSKLNAGGDQRCGLDRSELLQISPFVRVLLHTSLGRHILRPLLCPEMMLRSSPPKRPLRKVFVNLSSVVHIASYSGGIQFSHLNDKTWYSDTRAYSQSKLANFFHAKELAIRFKAEGVDITANTVHPGFIMTPLMAMRFKVEMARAKRTIRRTPPQYRFF